MTSVPGFLTGPLERIDPAAGATQVLVLTTDAENAVALAETVLRMTGPAGVELFPVTSARRAARLMAGRPVLAAAGAPGDIRDLMRGSHLKLDGIRTVVLAWADELLAGSPADIDALESIMGELPREAARVVVTSRSEARVNAFAERYLRRAHREPEPALPENAAPIDIQYVMVSAFGRSAALRRLLDDLDPPSAVVVAESEETAAEANRALRSLGYKGDAAAVRVSRGEVAPNTNAVIFFEPPVDRSLLAAAVEAGAVVLLALVQPREVGELRRLSGGEVRPFTLREAGNAARESEIALRRELGAVLEAGVPARELLALEPLLERFDGIEIAAAALRLLERERIIRKGNEAAARARPEASKVSPMRSGPPDRERRPGPPARGRDDRSGGRPPSRDRSERPARDANPRGRDSRPPRGGFSRPPRRDQP
ncbi:MAG: DEAD/DEAH box helicase [Gemmatimonadaceae bacterium]